MGRNGQYGPLFYFLCHILRPHPVQGVLYGARPGLSWFEFYVFHRLPNSALADGNLSEAAGQLGNLVEHLCQSQPNPGVRPDETPRIKLWTLWSSRRYISSVMIKVSDFRFEAAITKQESDSTEPRHYGWTLWKAKIPVKKGQVTCKMDISLFYTTNKMGQLSQ